MDIHVVRPGETLYSIALSYGVAMSQLLADNQPPDPARLVVGQSLVIQYPEITHLVAAGDTLHSIAAAYEISVRQLLRNNPALGGESTVYPGQSLVITFREPQQGTLSVNGYAYPFIDKGLLQRTLPFLSELTPFTYGFTPQGDLVPIQDPPLREAARQMDVSPVFHLSTLTEEGTFSSAHAEIALTQPEVQTRLVEQVLAAIEEKGYLGLDVDFEYIPAPLADRYVDLIARFRAALSPRGVPVTVALAPKSSPDQPGLLYEGHQYGKLAQAADFVLLMTYEWGYTYGPPMAVAPLNKVRSVVEYALTEMPAEKVYLGIPNYGYDWVLPFQPGSRATSISNQYALVLAARYYAAIRFDQHAQSPWFRYVDEGGQEHEVWFEDARSIRTKLALAANMGLHGVGYWNLMRPFPQNWAVLNGLFHIRDEDL